MQEISVRISSNKDKSEVLLVEDESKINVVNLGTYYLVSKYVNCNIAFKNTKL
jgi:hypothetical protein